LRAVYYYRRKRATAVITRLALAGPYVSEFKCEIYQASTLGKVSQSEGRGTLRLKSVMLFAIALLDCALKNSNKSKD
jgi:hypothetical protein